MSMRRAVLFVNLNKEHSSSFKEIIQNTLEKRGFAVTPFCFEGRPSRLPSGDWDIAFSLGGDGTVLFAARSVAPLGVPVFPVNLGTLGFIAGVRRDEWEGVFDQWQKGEAKFSPRSMLELYVERQGERLPGYNCLNDIVISASGIAKLIRLQVQLQGSSGEHIELGSYRCDGLIFATATGSTAYSMAAGGPILDPEMEAVILNPICPFPLANRPLVLPSWQNLVVTVEDRQRSGVLLTVDGQDTFELKPLDRIIVSHAPYRAQLISMGPGAYYRALRAKLNWSDAATDAGETHA